jgi:hypothetical protein
VRIDPKYGYPTQGPEKSQSRASKGSKGRGASRNEPAVDAKLGQEVKPFLEKAAQLPEIRQDQVQAAREALANGELDSPQAYRRVAEILLQNGI